MGVREGALDGGLLVSKDCWLERTGPAGGKVPGDVIIVG